MKPAAQTEEGEPMWSRSQVIAYIAETHMVTMQRVEAAIAEGRPVHFCSKATHVDANELFESHYDEPETKDEP